jgi:peroxisomal membrane protein 4
MTFLFRHGTLIEKIRAILLATYTHATNLARFTLIYKSMRLIFKLLFKNIKEYHVVLAAFAGGYFVFGEKNNVNEQVRLSFKFNFLFYLMI